MGSRTEVNFDPAKHVYTLHGRRLPSVTQILGANGFYEFPFASPEDLAYKMQLGRDVHAACDLYDRGVLDWTTITEEVLAYFEGWIKFRNEHPTVAIVATEQLVHHRALGYAGTLDRVLGFAKNDRRMADIKIGAEIPAAAMQTAAYKAAYNDWLPALQQVGRRLSIHLTVNGTYRLVEHDDPDDFGAFCAALKLFHWRGKK